MTKRELLNELKGLPMDAEILLVDAKDFKDIEYAISGVCAFPLDVPVEERDEVNIIFNEGVFSE